MVDRAATRAPARTSESSHRQSVPDKALDDLAARNLHSCHTYHNQAAELCVGKLGDRLGQLDLFSGGIEVIVLPFDVEPLALRLTYKRCGMTGTNEIRGNVACEADIFSERFGQRDRIPTETHCVQHTSSPHRNGGITTPPPWRTGVVVVVTHKVERCAVSF